MTNNETTGEMTKSRGKALQLILSLLIFAAFVVFLFVPDIALLDASLWSQVLDLFKGELAYGSVLKSAMYAAVGAYAVLLVCTVAAFFCKRRGARALNYLKSLVLLAVAVFFAYALTKELGASFSDIFTDEKTFFALNSVSLSVAVALLAIIVLNFTAYKGFGIVKLIFAALGISFLAFTGKTFIESYNFNDLLNGIELGNGALNTITQYTFMGLAWAVLVNAVLALFVLILPRTGVLDVIRSIIVFVLAAAAAILLGVTDSFANLLDYMGTVIFAGIALVQLIYAIIVVAVLHSKKKKLEEQKEAEEDAAFAIDANNQMTFRGLGAPAAQQDSAQQPAAPVTEEASAPEINTANAETNISEEAERTNKAFEEAAQISIDDIARETQTEEYDDIIRDEQPEIAEEEEKPFDFEQTKYDGNFNRAYQDFAEEEERKQQAAQQQAQQQTYYNYQQPQTPPYYANQQQPYGQQLYTQQQPFYTPGYIPDAFISSLTPAERDEFDRLFISRIYGENKRLPAYRIGGDNREFFVKIFVFMGRYRNVISDGLLEKIYNYSNSIR